MKIRSLDDLVQSERFFIKPERLQHRASAYDGADGISAVWGVEGAALALIGGVSFGDTLGLLSHSASKAILGAFPTSIGGQSIA
jgi:hypothetical protein